MKKTVLSALTLLTAAGYAHQEAVPEMEIVIGDAPYQHIISPKAIWRNHKETGYVYQTYAGGVEYQLFKPLGFNFSISSITNGKESTQLVETESSFSYKIGVGNIHALYPILTTRHASHRIKDVEAQRFFVNKTTLFGGFGWETHISTDLRVRGELSYFRDLHNALLVQEPDHFWGKTYSNPDGLKGALNLTYCFTEHLNAEASGYFAQTFTRCYREIGVALSAQWGF